MSNNYLFGTGNQEIGNANPMRDATKVIAQNVRRHREAAGMSQAELAKAIGVKSQNTIATLELGGGTKHLSKIAKALKVRLVDLDPSAEQEETVIIPQGSGGEQRDVYASVEAGAGALVVSNEPIQRTQGPRSLEGVRGGYGILVVGESMIPVIRPGYIVWLNPHLVPRVGEICVFTFEAHGEVRATIKEYCGQSPDSWMVKRYQPKERKFSLSKADWPKCSVVVAVDYGR